MSDDQVLELQNEKIDSLLTEFKLQRDEIQKYIEQLDQFRPKIDTLLPESLDRRYKFFFEEKVKVITSLFTVLLDMRKEIIKSIKDEIELRRKSITGSEIEDIEKFFDVRKVARTIDTFSKKVGIREEEMKKVLEQNDTELEDIKSLVGGLKNG
jgi:hypothetical protein